MAEETTPGPRVVEAFQGYAPSFDISRVIRRMLRVVPPNFLWGLHAIVLTNVGALSRKERERKTWGRRRVKLGEALGYYSQEWKGEPARITILVDNFEKQLVRSWMRFGIVRDLKLSDLFFHELGHHIHRVHRPEYEGKENVADQWSKKLSRKFMRIRCWYLIPVVAPIALTIRLGRNIAKLYPKARR